MGELPCQQLTGGFTKVIPVHHFPRCTIILGVKSWIPDENMRMQAKWYSLLEWGSRFKLKHINYLIF